ncbi:hypothetical protein NIES592_08090 [Fischerella major NIES-592]|uniref:Uncharacterized protein n=1 Tax=Fischerella major NIES-592 TaxID=210994 RepID=A0A1U7H1F5_9CYAN|nr:hypothetical protein [Fischerella major]OKH14827.1 hypothetical protein NIES592_08090 [Fischerella major NIES-592]
MQIRTIDKYENIISGRINTSPSAAHFNYLLGENEPWTAFIEVGEPDYKPSYSPGYNFIRRDEETKLLARYTLVSVEDCQPSDDLLKYIADEIDKTLITKIWKCTFSKAVLPDSEQDPDYEKKLYPNSAAIVFCVDGDVVQFKEMLTDSGNANSQWYVDNKWKLRDEGGIVYVAERIEVIDPTSDNTALFQQVSSMCEDILFSQIHKVYFELAT